MSDAQSFAACSMVMPSLTPKFSGEARGMLTSVQYVDVDPTFVGSAVLVLRKSVCRYVDSGFSVEADFFSSFRSARKRVRGGSTRGCAAALALS